MIPVLAIFGITLVLIMVRPKPLNEGTAAAAGNQGRAPGNGQAPPHWPLTAAGHTIEFDTLTPVLLAFTKCWQRAQ